MLVCNFWDHVLLSPLEIRPLSEQRLVLFPSNFGTLVLLLQEEEGRSGVPKVAGSAKTTAVLTYRQEPAPLFSPQSARKQVILRSWGVLLMPVCAHHCARDLQRSVPHPPAALLFRMRVLFPAPRLPRNGCPWAMEAAVSRGETRDDGGDAG